MNRAFVICIFIILNYTSCGILNLAYNEDEATISDPEVDFPKEVYVPFDITYKWKLEALRTDPKESFMKIIHKDKIPTLQINKDSRVNGYDGCNGFSSKIIVNNYTEIKFLGFLATQRGCHPSVYWHGEFYKAMGTVNNYSIQNGKLYFKKDSYALMVFSKIGELDP